MIKSEKEPKSYCIPLFIWELISRGYRLFLLLYLTVTPGGAGKLYLVLGIKTKVGGQIKQAPPFYSFLWPLLICNMCSCWKAYCWKSPIIWPAKECSVVIFFQLYFNAKIYCSLGKRIDLLCTLLNEKHDFRAWAKNKSPKKCQESCDFFENWNNLLKFQIRHFSIAINYSVQKHDMMKE